MQTAGSSLVPVSLRHVLHEAPNVYVFSAHGAECSYIIRALFTAEDP